MTILEDQNFRELELAVEGAVRNHLELAAHWRTKYLEGNYSVFDDLAGRHESLAKSIQAGWKLILKKLSQ
jgi:hypothetical protein